MWVPDHSSRDGLSATLNTQTTLGQLDHEQDRVQPSADMDRPACSSLGGGCRLSTKTDATKNLTVWRMPGLR